MPDPSVNSPKPPPHPPKAAVKSFGGYEMEGELGRGGMGVVYLARQIKLNRRVALKMLTGHYGPPELQRFLAEAETAAGLHHTNIAHIYEVGENEGAPFYSMEFVESGSLADRLRKELPSPREAAQILIQVARALHFAHQNGVVHRDMKPGNILLDADGIPKVADFGIAKRLKEDTHLTVSGAVIGTPTYMAPEQAKGTSRHVGPAADVYSLGAILYEMLAGRPPFLPEDSETAITVRVLTEDPVSPAWHRPEIPRDLEVICMKCLEKEPRDRYPSAAAFAEDLRRFLDDETIVARPPTTVVRTLKWLRRHPWKFVIYASAVLLFMGALSRLWRWEFYSRPHIEFGTARDSQFGGPTVLDPLSPPQAKHRSVSLRFTRRGRWGPITRVEALNSRQHPAAVYQFFGYDVLTNWIEGQLEEGSQRRRETTSIDYLYQNRTAIEATGRDCNGIINWRIIFDRPSSDNQRLTHGRYVTFRGFDFASREGASVIEFERDANGRDIKVTFFNSSGQHAANGEGVYGYALERDSTGHVVRSVNLDRDGAPGQNRLGQVGYVNQFDQRGLCTRTEFRDTANKPVAFHGISALTTSYDAAGNSIRLTRLNAANQPTNGELGDWAVQELDRNDGGDLTELRFLTVNPDGQLSIARKKVFAYDENGYPSKIESIGRTSWRNALKYDERGNLLEQRILGPDGQTMNGPAGWAVQKHNWKFSSDVIRQEETWFDAKDAPAYDEYGEHRRISEFDAAGSLRRLTTEGHDPARYKYQRFVSEPEYDAQGRLRRTSVRFENADGTPATKAGLAYTGQEVTFDENEREIKDWKLGCNVKEIGGPNLLTETEWQRTGARKRIIRQVCDEQRKPVPFVSNGSSARMEREFNSIDTLERLYETGFDESLVGFSTREAKFSSGVLQSVTHRKSDGTVVPSVRVFIKSVTPSQPKAAELHAGDQLLAANDKPATNAIAWVAAGNFPGGWIEVMRDGKRIRINGFAEGELGVILEDRAP